MLIPPNSIHGFSMIQLQRDVKLDSNYDDDGIMNQRVHLILVEEAICSSEA